jgi:predicted nucleotidyltransferase
MIHRIPLPPDIDASLATLGEVFPNCPGVEFSYLFGGAASGRKTPLSDIDIALYVEEGHDSSEIQIEVRRRAAKHLGTDEVDVIILNGAPIALRGRILQSRQILCDRNPWRRHTFESQTAREFTDFRKFETTLLNRRFARG